MYIFVCVHVYEKRKSKRERKKDGERPFKQKGESRNKTTHMWLIDFQQRDKSI